MHIEERKECLLPLLPQSKPNEKKKKYSGERDTHTCPSYVNGLVSFNANVLEFSVRNFKWNSALRRRGVLDDAVEVSLGSLAVS
jgi:hypothetical protein